MPHPALLSQALYSVPQLSEELQALGYNPGAPGYDSLKEEFGHRVGTATPHVRTIQKLFRGDLIKYSLCDGVVRLLNVARTEKGMSVLDGALIEENEYYIDGLLAAYGRVKKLNGNSQSVTRKHIARQIDRHSGLIRSLERGYRTTKDRCQLVADALETLYGEKCLVTNEPMSKRIRAGKSVKKRVTLRVVPKKLRD